MGSNSLNVDVNAFDGLPIVCRSEFFVFGLKVQIVHSACKMLWNFQFDLDEGFVNHNFRCEIHEFSALPGSTCFRIGPKFSCIPVHTYCDAVDQRKRF